MPAPTTLSRRAETLEGPRPWPADEPVPRLVDSAGLRSGGPGAWLVERHGGKTRRAWRKPHPGVDAGTGRTEAVALTTSEVDDGSGVGPWLDRVTGARSPRPPVTAPVTGRTGTGRSPSATPRRRWSCHHAGTRRCRATRRRGPCRRSAVGTCSSSSSAAVLMPLRGMSPRGIAFAMGWRRVSGYDRRASAGAAISRYKRVTGDGLRSRTDRRRASEVAIAVHVLNRMVELGRPGAVCVA